MASFDVASLTWMKVYDATSSWITSWLRRSLELKSVVVDMNHYNSKKQVKEETNQPKTLFLADLKEANLIKNDANDAEMIS